MKITFVLNENGISGGIKDVCMFSNNLAKLGHEVSIVYPVIPPRFTHKLVHPISAVTELGRHVLNRYPQPWASKDVKMLQVGPLNARASIPDADIVVATMWETAKYVAEFPKSKGRKFYLIQDYEDWYGFKKEIDQSFNLGMFNIVHSQWLSRKVILNGGKVGAVIPHAPDHNQFYPMPQYRNKDGFRILICYRPMKWKGIAEALEACRRVVYPHKHITMFGNDDKHPNFPDVEFVEKPTQSDIAYLYNASDVFLFPSLREGWGLPPMEAMACGTAVITTNVGGVPEYTQPGIDSIVVAPGDIDAMEKAIITLIEKPKLKEQIGMKAIEAMEKYTWEKSTKMLEQVFRE